MNTILKNLRRVCAAALIGCFVALEPKATAQQSIPLAVYPLVNSLAGTTNEISITNGASRFATFNSYTVNTTPAQIWRGRGFAFNAAFYATNASASNVCMTVRFAARHKSPSGTVITNWFTTGQYAPLQMNVALNGTTEVFYATNFPPTWCDNIDLVQLTTITNNHTSTLFWDPTNSFISVFP